MTVPLNPALDLRRNAVRPDLADARLKDFVVADRYVDGIIRRVVVPSTPIRRAARHDAAIDSEALQGELVRVFEETIEGWAWAQLLTDDYVGFIAADSLGPVGAEPTHRIAALRTFIYPGADLRFPALGVLSLNAMLALGEERETRGTLYRMLQGNAGAIIGRHAVPLGTTEHDYVAVAERFLHTPYLWGGRSSIGLDCSALVQLSLAAAGIAAPRDSDQQAGELGEPIGDEPLRRGDFVFWKGHVGMMQDAKTLLHASGFHMMVVSEPLSEAISRIEPNSGRPIGMRRLG